MFKYHIILIFVAVLLISGCEEPSGLDTERMTRVLDSIKLVKNFVTPSMNTSMYEDVEGILAFSVGGGRTEAIIINEENTLDHKVLPDSKVIIDTSGGVIRYTGTVKAISSDTLSAFLPGNLSLERFTRLHSVTIKLDSLTNNLDLSNPNGLQRNDVHVEFVSLTNGTASKQKFTMTSVLATTIPILGQNLSVLKFEGIISLNKTITYGGYTISKFRCNFDVLLSW